MFWWLPIGSLAGFVALISTIGVGRWPVTVVFTTAFALIGGVGLTLLPDLLLGRYRWRCRARTE